MTSQQLQGNKEEPNEKKKSKNIKIKNQKITIILNLTNARKQKPKKKDSYQQ